MSPPILDPIRGALLRSQPDGRLVALAREGRERALEEIVRRYRAPLVAFAAMFVPAHRADDVVQESLLRAFDALRSSETEIRLRPWLFRIVRNQALNDLRDTPVEEELTEGMEGPGSPEGVAERREEIAALVGGLRALPDAQREAIVARELEGRGHSEIAAELGTSPGAVRQLIFRARATLRGAAGLLIPLPFLRFLLGPGGSEAAGAAAAAGVGAAAATAGGGAAAGATGKVAVGLTGVILAVGGGIAAERGGDRGDRIASADGGAISGPGEQQGERSGTGESAARGSGSQASSGEGGAGTGSSSGSRRGGGEQSESGGGGRGEDGGGAPGRLEDADDDSSGPGGSGGGSGDGFNEDDVDDGHSEQVELPAVDESSSGPSGSGSSGTSGSGTSGSGSSGSGISGSGISDSGSGSSGSSSSGSSERLDHDELD